MAWELQSNAVPWQEFGILYIMCFEAKSGGGLVLYCVVVIFAGRVVAILFSCRLIIISFHPSVHYLFDLYMQWSMALTPPVR